MKAIALLPVYTYMDSVMKADIFFFISSIAVIVLTLGALVVGYYVVRSLQRIERLGEGIEDSIIYNLVFKKRNKN